MDHSIGVGILVGAVITIGTFIYNSTYFSSTQKKFIIPLLIFPPVGIVSIIIIWIYNEVRTTNNQSNPIQPITQCEQSNITSDLSHSKTESSIQKDNNESSTFESRISELNSQIELLANAKQNGVLTDKEYSEKVTPILEEKSILEEKQRNLNHLCKIIEQNKEKFDNLEKLKATGLISEDEYNLKINELINLHKNPLKISSENNHSKNLELMNKETNDESDESDESDNFYRTILILAVTLTIVTFILSSLLRS